MGQVRELLRGRPWGLSYARVLAGEIGGYGPSLRALVQELAGLLESLPPEESQTRWHLALAVARVAHTRMQRLRAARTMSLLVEDESNALRCAAMEGMATLALGEPSLREEAEALVEQFLWNGTPAMKARARHMRKLLAKKHGER